MKSHRSLGAERHAVRRYANVGDGFRQPNVLNGNFKKLFYAAVTRTHQTILTGTQKVSEKNCASVRFPAIPCPESVCGELHAVRWGALLCDACQMAHSATVRSGHHRPTGNTKMSLRQAVRAASARGSFRPPGSERETHQNLWGMQNMAPRRIYLAAHQCTNHQPNIAARIIFIGDQTASHQGGCGDE